jgi:hypothetical protein
MNKSYTVKVEEGENGDLLLPLPDEMLNELGWKEGDQLDFKDNENGSFSIFRVEEEKEWVLVETVQTFRHRYCVQVPKGKKEWALDTVVCEEAKEFSQLHIGENIISHRVVAEEEALRICDEDNDYVKSWTSEQKMKSFFTKIGEKVNLK